METPTRLSDAGEEDVMLHHDQEKGITKNHPPLTERLRTRQWAAPRPVVIVSALLLVSMLLQLRMWTLSNMKTKQVPVYINSAVNAIPRPTADKAVVVASHFGQDVSWASRLSPDWWVFRYILDDTRVGGQHWPPGFADMTNEQRIENHNSFTVSGQTGREAMVYLTFIIDNYDNLPLFTYFIHGHETGWHQPENITDKIQALNFTALAEDGYTNLACHDRRLCKEDRLLDLSHGAEGISQDGFKPIPSLWKLVFGDSLPLPKKFANPWAAQFAVTRANIQARPLEYWKALRRPLERNLSEYREELPELQEDGAEYRIGIVYEMLWHVFMGMQDVYCNSHEYCQNTMFSGALSCEGPDHEWKPFNYEPAEWHCQADQEAMARAKETQETEVKAARGGIVSDVGIS